MASASSTYIYFHSEYGVLKHSVLEVGMGALSEDQLTPPSGDDLTFLGWYSSPNFEENTKVEPGYFIGDGETVMNLYAKWDVVSPAPLEYIIANKEDFISVANVIREKTGTTEGLTFPGGFIDAIESGGGGVEFGVVTITSDSDSGVEIYHGLGVVPNAVIFINLDVHYYTHPNGTFALLRADFKDNGYCGIVSSSYGKFSTYIGKTGNFTNGPYGKATYCTPLTENRVSIDKTLVGGARYFWIVFAEQPF